jgi:hypothetical protein
LTSIFWDWRVQRWLARTCGWLRPWCCHSFSRWFSPCIRGSAWRVLETLRGCCPACTQPPLSSSPWQSCIRNATLGNLPTSLTARCATCALLPMQCCHSATISSGEQRIGACFAALSRNREIRLIGAGQGPPRIRLPDEALGVWNATQGYPGEGPESAGATREEAVPRKRGIMDWFRAPDPKQAHSGAAAAAVLLFSPLLKQSSPWTYRCSGP